jgi:N-acetylglucosamine-6-phosphate deacetylase
MKKIPGFVDIQINGFLGVDFSESSLSEDDFIFSCRKIIERGTAAFLPTVITSSAAVYEKNLPKMAKIMDMPEFKGHIPGFHLEGPFISPEPGAVGAHNPEYVRKPDIDFLSKLIEWSNGKIKILTVAAEAEGVEELIKFASEKGITVSVGHQLAGVEDLQKAVKCGAKAVTHLGNGMPNMIHRHKNTLWATLAEDNLSALLITDGHHLPPELIKVALRAKGIERAIVISDASPIAGNPPGKYNVLGNNAVLEENGFLHNPEKGCMVGSSACVLDCMNYLASLKLLDFEALMDVGFKNPLKLIGVNEDSVEPCENVFYNESENIFKTV